MKSLDLDALIQTARLEAAARRSNDAAAAEVLRLLAEAGGSMPVQTLLDSGVPRDLIASLVVDDPDDKRKKRRARLGIVNDVAVAWLTSTGWQSTGRASGREVVPTSDSIEHATTPGKLQEWIDKRQGTLATHQVRVRTVAGGACRRWSTDLQNQAWGVGRQTRDATGAVSLLSGGLIPDALQFQSLPVTPQGAAMFQQLWGEPPTGPDDLAETTLGVEVEDHMKSIDGCRSKVERWDTVIESVGAAFACLWVVRTGAVARRLRDLGVDSDRRPRQLLVPALSVGLRGEVIEPPARPWWLLGVPEDPEAGPPPG